MNSLGVFLAIILVVAILYVAGFILPVIAKALNLSVTLLDGIISRANADLKISIDERLEGDYSDKYFESTKGLLEGDEEEKTLKKYDPFVPAPPRREAKVYSNTTPSFSTPTPSTMTKFKLTNLHKILNVGPPPDLSRHWSVIEVDTNYPVNAPSYNIEIEKPPDWTAWPEEIPDPRIALPLYKGNFTFLNFKVLEAHKKAISRVEEARSVKERIETTYKQRNERLNTLARQAKEKWEKALKKRDKNLEETSKEYESSKDRYLKALQADKQSAINLRDSCKVDGADGLLNRISLVINRMNMPEAVPRECKTRIDVEEGILIHEQKLPELV